MNSSEAMFLRAQDGAGLNGSIDLGDDNDSRRAAIEQVYSKILRTKDLIKGEQTARDGKKTIRECLFSR